MRYYCWIIISVINAILSEPHLWYYKVIWMSLISTQITWLRLSWTQPLSWQNFINQTSLTDLLWCFHSCFSGLSSFCPSWFKEWYMSFKETSLQNIGPLFLQVNSLFQPLHFLLFIYSSFHQQTFSILSTTHSTHRKHMIRCINGFI